MDSSYKYRFRPIEENFQSNSPVILKLKNRNYDDFKMTGQLLDCGINNTGHESIVCMLQLAYWSHQHGKIIRQNTKVGDIPK